MSLDWERTSISLLLLSHCSCVRLSVIPWTAARQAPLSMGFLGQEYWRGLPFPPPGDLPDLGNEPGSPALQADFLSSEPPGMPINRYLHMFTGFPGGASGKEPDCQGRRCKRHGSGLRRSPGRRHGKPLQYSCLENPTDRGAWQARVLGSQRVRHD